MHAMDPVPVMERRRRPAAMEAAAVDMGTGADDDMSCRACGTATRAAVATCVPSSVATSVGESHGRRSREEQHRGSDDETLAESGGTHGSTSASSGRNGVDRCCARELHPGGDPGWACRGVRDNPRMFRTSLLLAATALLAACATPPAPPVTTATGLVYQSLREGTGPSPAATDVVQVHYRGTLPEGREFDSSYGRGRPAEFPLNRVIPCWTEGVQRMKIGGKARLTCPPALAYGERGAGGVIPPNATLVFEVELLGIQR